MPAPIGRIMFDQPRAVRIREPENLESIHSAIHSALNVTVDSMLEATAIMKAWPVLMQRFSDSIEEILSALPANAEAGGG